MNKPAGIFQIAGELPYALLVVMATVCNPIAASAAAARDCDPDSPSTWPDCEVGNLCLCADDDVEYRRDLVVLNNVILYQGGSPLLVRAKHAETPSIDFNDSIWYLTGGVQSRLIQGELAADNATVHIKLGRLSAATFRGTPATFEESSTTVATANGALSNVRGSAGIIEYSLASSDIRFTNDVRLFNGCNSIRGAGFVYDLSQKTLKSLGPADGVDRERIHGTFQQQCKPGMAAAEPPP